MKKLAENGQIATQYVDLEGKPTMDAAFNPNGSVCAIEGITSPDGRVFGKMGHSERIGKDLYRNVPGEYDIRMFEAAVKYFKSAKTYEKPLQTKPACKGCFVFALTNEMHCGKIDRSDVAEELRIFVSQPVLRRACLS